MKRFKTFGLFALGLSAGLVGCSEEPKAGGNNDAAAVVGASPDSPDFNQASSNLMNKMHGDSLKTTKGKTAAPAKTETKAEPKTEAPKAP